MPHESKSEIHEDALGGQGVEGMYLKHTICKIRILPSVQMLLPRVILACQIHTQMAVTVEHASVLDCDSDIPECVFEFIDRHMMRFTPCGAIGKQHIGALGLCACDTLKMVCNVITCEVHVISQHQAQFIEPFVACWLICTDQRVHGQHVHLVVMTEGCFFCHALTYP